MGAAGVRPPPEVPVVAASANPSRGGNSYSEDAGALAVAHGEARINLLNLIKAPSYWPVSKCMAGQRDSGRLHMARLE